MRAAWVDKGNDPDYAKLAANGITAAYFDIRDPRLSVAYFNAQRGHGLAVGVYAVDSWWPGDTGPQFATWVSKLLDGLAPETAPDFPMVCLDLETKDAGFLLGALQQWRKHRPNRVTDWTLEGHQGGILNPAQWLLASQRVRYIVPQCYNGAMTEVWDTFAMAKYLNDYGLPFASVRPFYDAAHLPAWWDGYAFTQGRLP